MKHCDGPVQRFGQRREKKAWPRSFGGHTAAVMDLALHAMETIGEC